MEEQVPTIDVKDLQQEIGGLFRALGLELVDERLSALEALRSDQVQESPRLHALIAHVGRCPSIVDAGFASLTAIRPDEFR